LSLPFSSFLSPQLISNETVKRNNIFFMRFYFIVRLSRKRDFI
jgi:hypothetical protein